MIQIKDLNYDYCLIQIENSYMDLCFEDWSKTFHWQTCWLMYLVNPLWNKPHYRIQSKYVQRLLWIIYIHLKIFYAESVENIIMNPRFFCRKEIFYIWKFYKKPCKSFKWLAYFSTRKKRLKLSNVCFRCNKCCYYLV